MIYMISVGLGGVVSTWVSNELGAGNATLACGAYYVVGIPCGAVLAFVFHMRGMVGIYYHIHVKNKLWIGIICGLYVQALILIIINLGTNWTIEVSLKYHHLLDCFNLGTSISIYTISISYIRLFKLVILVDIFFGNRVGKWLV